MQESRLFRIVYYLLEHGKATAPELAQKLEVSVRTVYRDIDTISSAGIPVYAVQGKGGGISLLDDYTLEKSLLSGQEREQILMALQGMIAATGKDSDELLTKLSGLFRMKYTKWIEVDFSDWIYGKPQQKTFQLLKDAVFQKRVVSFRYFGGNGSEKRNVQPLCLVFKSKDWYLYGFCLLRNDFRFFKLTRIKEIELLSDTFIRDFTQIEIKKQIRVEKTVTVKLKFDRKIAFRVYDEFADGVTEDAQGNLYVQADFPNHEVLYSYILSFADCAEVLEPQNIREEIKKRLQKMQEKYKT